MIQIHCQRSKRSDHNVVVSLNEKFTLTHWSPLDSFIIYRFQFFSYGRTILNIPTNLCRYHQILLAVER